MKQMNKIPKSFQPILWSMNVKNLDLEKNKVYIIHQVLAYGTLEEIRWLFKVYGQRTMRNIFLRYPQNIYSPPVLYLVKNIILGLKNIIISKKQYVKTLF